MHEEMRSLLNAYLDDELHGTRLLELKVHLASCKACQQELKELRLVSELLQAAPAPEFTPADRFVSNLALTLPRRELKTRPAKTNSLFWWLVPAGLLSLFFFVRTVFTLTNAVHLADYTGLLGNAADWLGAGQESLWYQAAMTLTGGQMAGTQTTLTVVNDASVLGVNLLNGVLWQGGIVLLLAGWLAAWWFRNRPRLLKVAVSSSRS